MTSPATSDAIELGLDTFGDVTIGPTGTPLSHGEVLRHVVEEGSSPTRSAWRSSAWARMTRAHFEREAGPAGALFVGAPETAATKIAATARALGLSRFDMKYSNGALPHAALMSSIELYGTRVMPRVRELLAN